MRHAEYVFYKGELVRSRYHGLGQVTKTGTRPCIRFLDGRECCVFGDTIRLVPQEVYDAELRNRTLIERYLTLRIYGFAPTQPTSLPRTEFDLEAALMRHAQSPPLPITEATSLGSSVLFLD